MFLQRSSLSALMLAIAAVPALARNPASPQPPTASQDVAQHAQELRAQCPADPRLPPDDDSTKPIHVTTWGHTGPKILLIHGGEKAIDAIGGGPQNFSDQKTLGEHGWQVSLPERPGFGKSPSRGRDDQIADARWIAEMLRQSGGSNLWGHSFGGAEALLAAAEAPASVRSLILIEPDLWPLAQVFPASEVPAPVREFRDVRAQAILASVTPQAYAANFLSTFQPQSGGVKIWLTRHALKLAPGLERNIGCGALLAREANGAEFLEAISTVKASGIPVLIVTGGWSPARDALGAWVATLVGGKHVIVPSPNHIIMKENPKELDEVAVKFMRAADRMRPAQ